MMLNDIVKNLLKEVYVIAEIPLPKMKTYTSLR